ncbi:MAG: hypothetical protein HYV90_00905 [Candidatus Woesebacteria bacterium]|nr:MAG: hypothetical protein HYV90_00905 [Candidatus Woesebacteria bacterium]
MDDEVIKTLRNDNTYLLEVCQGLEQLRVGNKSDIKQSQVEAFLAGNKVVSDLNKYFFGFATLLVPIIFSFSTVDEVRQKLDKSDSLLLELSLIFLFSSLVSGLLHMASEYKFFKRWLKNQDKKLKQWASVSFWPSTPTPSKISQYLNEYESIKKETEIIDMENESESNLVHLIMQGTFWLIGIMLLIITVFRVLS